MGEAAPFSESQQPTPKTKRPDIVTRIVTMSEDRLQLVQFSMAAVAVGSLLTAGFVATFTPEGHRLVKEVFTPDAMQGTPLDPAHSAPLDHAPELAATDFSLPQV